MRCGGRGDVIVQLFKTEYLHLLLVSYWALAAGVGTELFFGHRARVLMAQ